MHRLVCQAASQPGLRSIPAVILRWLVVLIALFVASLGRAAVELSFAFDAPWADDALSWQVSADDF